LDFGVPQRAEPGEQKHAGGQAQGRREKRKNQRGPGIEAARKHVLAPDAKTEEADTAESEDCGALRPDWLAGERGEQVRDDSETRKHGNVDFGLGEKPEEALPERKECGLRDGCRLMRKKIEGREKLRSEQTVREKENASGQQDAENQHAENGVDEPGPDGERHARQGHAFGAKVERGDGEIDGSEKRCEAEERNAGGPERESSIGLNEKRRGDADDRDDGGPKRKKIERRESHFAGANLERQEVVAEAGLWRGGKNQENHQRAVEHSQGRVALWSVGEPRKKWNLRGGPDQVDAHQEREEHSEENAA